jgi:peptidoglycan/xylan/chitin deacetylase (PgdA/CDA1 family)
MKHYHVVNFEKAHSENFSETQRKPLATVMFDDGFQDNIEYAADILRAECCPASFYIVTDCVESGKPTWTYCLDYQIIHSRIKELSIDSPALPDSLRKTVLLSRERRIDYGKQLKPFLKTLSQGERIEILRQIEAQCSDCEIPNCMMDWRQVSQLANDGFVIGSHTVTHPLLATIEDSAVLDYELTHSRKRIGAMIGILPKSISYPIGSFNSSVIDASRRAGYEVGLAVMHKSYERSRDSEFAVPRIELYNENWARTLLRLHGWIHRIKSWRRAG